MTPEKRARLRELPALIANEDDPDAMKNLALEFQRLLDEEAGGAVQTPPGERRL
jgi:hypothetical protein